MNSNEHTTNSLVETQPTLSADELTRRRFLGAAGATAIAAGAGLGALDATAEVANAQATSSARAPLQPPPPVRLPPLSTPTEKAEGQPPAPLPPSQRVGYAIVGLGHLTLNEILPAFGECKMSRLVALVTGEREKGLTVARQYGLEASAVYSYADYDRLRDNPAVEVIYIVLPNSMHEEYTVRGAKAGKHILCEKPMATSSASAKRMIQACQAANRKLMIAYRIQYEPYNREARRIIRSGALGKAKLMETINGQAQGDPNQWRQKKALAGGGSLPDIGLYCLNTTRFLLGEEPIEIMASTYSTPGDPRFKEVEENCLWQMRFPSGVQANCAAAYATHNSKRYRMHLETGWIEMSPAYFYTGLRMEIARAEGKSERIENRQLNPENQFATEIDHMSDCVIHNKTPFTPGEEGLQDQILMEAIYRSAREGKSISLAPVPGRDAFRGPEPKAG
ncbi:glucose--fructose oxidoreductase [Abditibacteriota bacterium]|nr:glucose--fructose oxidoreductase [Abditibacteriota bacterium]